MKTYITANWKMNKMPSESVDFLEKINFPESDIKLKTIIFPPFVSLDRLVKFNFSTTLGAQNIHHEGEGAFTGEISAKMILDMGVKYVLIGHSERRHLFNESDSIINQKIHQAIKNSLHIIFCIGEKLSERKNENTFLLIQKQLKNALRDITVKQMEKIIIAYEPVWAIGTGLTATPEQAQEVHFFIREELGKIFSPSLANSTPLLYGGSVTSSNIRKLLNENDINGALIGGAALDINEFNNILKVAEKI